MNQRGTALLLVVWVLALLSFMAMTMLKTVRSDTRIASISLRQAQDEALTESAINAIILRLVDPVRDDGFLLDGTPSQIEVEGHSLSFTLHDEAGRVDVNTAPQKLLEAAFVAGGATPDRARGMAQALVKVREQPYVASSTSWLKTAVMAGSEHSGRSFQSVDELAAVPGVDRDLLDSSRLFLTVYTGLGGVDLRFADHALSHAVVQMTEVPMSAVTQDQGTREAMQVENSLGGRVIRISLTTIAGTSDHAKDGFYAIVRITGNRLEPYWLLAQGNVVN